MSPSGEDTYFPKFRTIRRSTGDELDPTTTFTLLPNKDKHAVVALRAYIESIRSEAPGLAVALTKAFPGVLFTKETFHGNKVKFEDIK